MKNYSPIVRLYYYSDVHRSYGDAGTFKYVRMDEDCFIGCEETAFNGENFTIWNYTQKGLDFVKSLDGYDHYCIGFQFSTIEEYKNEVNKLKKQLKTIIEIVG